MTFHENCLPSRQFTWNVDLFSRKNKQKNRMLSTTILHGSLWVKAISWKETSPWVQIKNQFKENFLWTLVLIHTQIPWYNYSWQSRHSEILSWAKSTLGFLPWNLSLHLEKIRKLHFCVLSWSTWPLFGTHILKF